ncbi:hypothetical protein ACJIZ3_010706 [Penstemon smallii]|uniref:Reticulon-like protein n=1 Tax=Penstemon smallii TaxID=265156 RepID=A0ABD3UH16_9LAMI
MDSTPPSHQSEPQIRPKSASRLSNLRHYSEEPIPQLSLEIVPSSPKISTPSPASTISPLPNYTVREILLHSPSALKRSKARVSVDNDAAIEPSGGRKRPKTRNSESASSPKIRRRSKKVREEREFCLGEEVLVKPKKKRNSGRPSKKDKLKSTRSIDGEGSNLDAIGEFINDLVMWRDVSKSSLWFGFGSLCFLSSCFTKGVNFSLFSLISRVGLLALGVSFFSNSARQRDGNEIKSEFKLTEDDILKVGKLVLPAANFAVSKIRKVFSGEPAMTLKVVPFLLLGAEYGHLITPWRLAALGFFLSFTLPKLYSTYSAQLSNKVVYLKSWASEAWGACTHKKIVTASAVSAFWNLTSIRTRIFAAFLCLVILRYHRQHSEPEIEEYNAEGKQEQLGPIRHIKGH